jgi:hypothetical protein
MEQSWQERQNVFFINIIQIISFREIILWRSRGKKKIRSHQKGDFTVCIYI